MDKVERFEFVVQRAGGRYIEIALTTGPVEQIRRFWLKAPTSEASEASEHSVAAEEYEVMLRRIHRRFAGCVAQQHDAVHISKRGSAIAESYAAILDAVVDA